MKSVCVCVCQEAVIRSQRGGSDGGVSDGRAAAGDSSPDVQYAGAEHVELHRRAARRHTQHHPGPAEGGGVAGAGARPVVDNSMLSGNTGGVMIMHPDMLYTHCYFR